MSTAEATAPSTEQTIASLQKTLAGLNGDDGGVTALPDEDVITEEQLAAYLADLDLGSNAYDPAAFKNAYGFSLEGNNQDSLIASNSGENSSGSYVRKAVKDRETGEIRYVNVPIGMGAVSGNTGSGQFRDQRRNGFGSMMV